MIRFKPKKILKRTYQPKMGLNPPKTNNQLPGE